MEYRNLGRTDIKVSVICLGTMTWGQQNSEAEAHDQLDAALERGINFFDTAEMYSIPTRAETCGKTEKYIGNWIKARNNRDRFILATKVIGPGNWLPHIRDGEARLDRKNIEAAVDQSLRRLQTDYIDLYQLHWPDRNTNYFGKLGYVHDESEAPVPIEETLAVLGELVTAGKIRHVGLSNETPWGIMRFLQVAESLHLPKVVSVQNPYNLLNRSFEVGCAEIAHREQVGLLAYSPLGFGVLSGKYVGGVKPDGARLTLFENYTRYTKPNAISATEAYVALARQQGLDPAQMALAYVNSRPFLTSTIIGATSMDQLNADIDSIELKLAPDVLEQIEEIHRRYPNPAP
ncbi:MAG: aldo/keto reductase [Acidithiobacillales bacterium SG8_45]|nr:MAG: aldo/keto reductase [Acidithiobacillales bacterium SG8_45]